MPGRCPLLCCLSVIVGAAGQYVENPLVTFDGANLTTFRWKTEDDSMMGGGSNASFAIHDGSATFQGIVAALPTPSGAPGFVRSMTVVSNFSQVNGCQGIVVRCKTASNFTGFRLSFGTDMYYSRRGYKAPLHVLADNDFHAVKISFYDFTRAWDDATGLPQVSCRGEEAGVCPTFLTLNNIQRLELSAQGALGPFAIDVKSVSAYGCAPHHSSPVIV